MSAVIRPYESKDKKLVQFMIGKANLQPLAVANNNTYLHPFTIGIWIGLSSVMIHYMNWWPAHEHGLMEYLKPLPALASIAVPIMFFVDWINRPEFEALTQEVVRHEDLSDIPSYYSKQPASGFWVLEYGETFVGLIAVDASLSRDKKTGPKTAMIRHFYVEESFRKTKIQADLLKYAVNHAFDKDPKIERIEAPDSPLTSYLSRCLREAGFELDHHTKKVGIMGWNMGVRYLGRDVWSKREL